MTWHVAASLNVLLGQLNAEFPLRSKVSDGSIGDAAHASRGSDHNPWYRNTVTARDFTHDVVGGLDCHWLAGELVRSGDRRIKYIIWAGMIWERATGWQRYRGVNSHHHHLHLSVVASPLCEDPTPWKLRGLGLGRPTVGEELEDDYVSMSISTFEASDRRQYRVVCLETRAVSGIVGDSFFSISSAYQDVVDFKATFWPAGKGGNSAVRIPANKRHWFAVPDGVESIAFEYTCAGPTSVCVTTTKR